MWHSRFFGTLLAVLALLGIMERASLAAYPTPSKFSLSQSQETRGFDGSFRIAIMGSSAVPLDIPVEKSPEEAQPEKPAVEKPKVVTGDSTVPPEEPFEKAQPAKPAVKKQKTAPKASKPKKKNIKKAKVKKAQAKTPVKEEEGFLTKTFKQLVGDDDDKKGTASKSQLQKTAGKKSEKEEEGLLTKTLKTLVGGEQKEEKSAKKNALNPINMAPTGSTDKKKETEQPKTAKSETKETLKHSFEKLIGVGAVDDEGASQSAKTDKPAGETKSAKKETSGGLLDGILGGGEKKKDSPATKQAKAEGKVEKASAPAKPKRITAKKYIEEEEGEQPKKNYAGAKKGKNVLKESFKTLVTDDKKKGEEE